MRLGTLEALFRPFLGAVFPNQGFRGTQVFCRVPREMLK